MNSTLVKGVSVLEHLLQAGPSASLTELARRTGLLPSNVHRTLQTWVHLGFVKQEPVTGLYQCTYKLFEWGSRVADQQDLRNLARPHLVQLAQQTQETIHLSVLDGLEVIYLDKIDSPQPVRAYSQLGGRAPAHCVATGKVLLAFGPQIVRQSLPPKLTRHSPNTLVDKTKLLAELEACRQKGYALNSEEWREGVSGLGAPVIGRFGYAVAAVGLSAPTNRLSAKKQLTLARNLVDAASAISRQIAGLQMEPGS